ncbi:hypothetical protein H112_01285 [Trichophyton rubrum D6]|uniref:Uncharacterized protein n=2 Tax=Trichophyton TaxID=5550 RepID=A0A022WD48_TRIRU|nr:hypothetical protein H100_01280 [Trichophyton rubrum MR850]EZF45636.1 hypothetical protein H102_01275 [Trichophyton rubrum CBS 100081]EZF56282.1 hypothetical protein H103_01284 [Trichophyton rubrum CBS 288.86]EZF77550.1 hypothetical protein H105_01289 [Trichophyton soudanense CBS 452.61]EZF98970.1 hypothetical protein H113_01284 [Trichophyton rubrum MR1459]EZG10106.1 hypothetical protein H106_01081 [Trichophyton rubrum CBS 735.88]KDB37376.1 hypothetical protein H112_01285 [Trichophyton rub
MSEIELGMRRTRQAARSSPVLRSWVEAGGEENVRHSTPVQRIYMCPHALFEAIFKEHNMHMVTQTGAGEAVGMLLIFLSLLYLRYSCAENHGAYSAVFLW